MEIRIAGVVKESIVDGPGLRFTLFVQGCIHNCKGCHNPQTHDLNAGKLVKSETILKAIKDNPLLDGVTFSGGEPFLQPEALYKLGKEIIDLGLDLITYTGYTFEQLLDLKDEYIKKLIGINKYIVDSKFEIEHKTYDVPFVGSSNQRIIDVKETIKNNEIKCVRF